MMERWFLAHPRSVNESYLEHQAVALSFSMRLFAAAAVCFVHALVPSLFERTGSRMITELHEKMVTKRLRHAPDAATRGAARSKLSRADS
jgi:hypothetical protein